MTWNRFCLIKKMGKVCFASILNSKYKGTLFIGVTSNLIKRVDEHKNDSIDGFSKNIKCVDWSLKQIHEDIYKAIQREKLLRKWNRQWKFTLIEENSPDWNDRVFN